MNSQPGKRSKTVLTAEQKYDLWTRILSGQITQSEAAAEAGVDRGVITRIRAVAKDSAIAGLKASKPGKSKTSTAERSEIAGLNHEINRLQNTIVEQAVELALLRGKAGWE